MTQQDWQTQLGLDGAGPVYEQIKRTLTEKIRSGGWQTGDRIPGEEDLAAHFNTARMTVHRALRELTDTGLLIRKRRAGTFVASPPAPAAMLEIVDMSKLIPGRGQAYAFELIDSAVVEAGEELRQRFDLSQAGPLRRLVCLHRADGIPVELEERWINLAVLPDAETADFSQSPPGAWLLQQAPWTQAEHAISARNASPAIAQSLDTVAGEACLVLERRTFLEQQVVTFARLTHPGSRHALTERFTPG